MFRGPGRLVETVAGSDRGNEFFANVIIAGCTETPCVEQCWKRRRKADVPLILSADVEAHPLHMQSVVGQIEGKGLSFARLAEVENRIRCALNQEILRARSGIGYELNFPLQLLRDRTRDLDMESRPVALFGEVGVRRVVRIFERHP